MARAGASNFPQSDDESDSEEYPSELNTLNSSAGFLVVSTDKLSVKYTAVNLHGHAVGAVQANKPAPVERLVYYFEMFVKEAGSKGQVSIGFTTEKFKMRRHPGWEANSIGYHGDDGLLYRGQAKGEAFGPTYSTGDIVGGGINYASREIFFTKNGIMVGAVHKDLRGPLFPTVAVHSQGEEVHVNFGQRCFAFDLKAFEAQERLKQQSAMENIPLPPNITYEIVRSYLIHYGYEDTLNSLYMATQSTSTVPVDQTNGFTEADIYALSQKRTLRQLIRSGNIDTAFDRLREWYPQNAQDDQDCLFLYCQKFIELVRVGELEEAVKYGRVELRKFFDVPECKKIVEKCVSLLAFEHPEDSFVGFLLKDSQRELVADMVNLMVLSTYIDTPARLRSPLERLLRQLAGCCLELRLLNGNQGEVFNLSKLLEATSKGNTP